MSTQPPSRRVAITGVGLISPIGTKPDEYWSALAEQRSGVRAPILTPPEDAQGWSLLVAGEARGFTGSIGDFGELESGTKKAIRKALKMMCRETQMAVAAAQLALADAGLAAGDGDPERAGVVLGSDYMLTMPGDYVRGVAKCEVAGEFHYEKWGDEGLEEVEPLWMLRYLPNMPASHIAIFNDLRGPNNSLTMREAGGLMAAGEAFRMIARGHADRMVAGATGTRLMPMQAIHSMQTDELAPPGDDPAAACRPFDRDRAGTVAGEGAGMVVLEALDEARRRGATIYGEVTGFGASQVTDHALRGRNDAALANATRAALRDAGRGPEGVGHVNAHGLGTRAGDAAESRAIRDVFGDHADKLPVVALKSYFGNLGAGGGVVELIGSLLAVREGVLPRVLNFQQADPDCPVAVVNDDATPPGEAFVSLNTTPQGQAVALCVARAE